MDGPDERLRDWLAPGEEPRPMHYALGEIPGADRNVLSLAYLRGLSHPATAALLDIPRETVQARVVGSLWALCHAI